MYSNYIDYGPILTGLLLTIIPIFRELINNTNKLSILSSRYFYTILVLGLVFLWASCEGKRSDNIAKKQSEELQIKQIAKIESLSHKLFAIADTLKVNRASQKEFEDNLLQKFNILRDSNNLPRQIKTNKVDMNLYRPNRTNITNNFN